MLITAAGGGSSLTWPTCRHRLPAWKPLGWVIALTQWALGHKRHEHKGHKRIKTISIKMKSTSMSTMTISMKIKRNLKIMSTRNINMNTMTRNIKTMNTLAVRNIRSIRNIRIIKVKE